VARQASKRHLNLALQGGGTHGAFTWGVLDRVLEDPALDIGWISGASAGALNAVAVACGLASAKTARTARDNARATLRALWHDIGQSGTPDMVRMNPLLAAPWASMRDSSALAQFAGMFSPSALNPLGLDPLRKLLDAHLDIEQLRATPGPELLIAATDVATGRARLFRRSEMTIDAVLASACLPMVQTAVQIDGRAYWDGGYSANPDLQTLAAESPVGDTLIVQLSALEKPGVPTAVRDIAGHVAHLTFNRPYLQELEAIEMLRRIDDNPQTLLRGWLGGQRSGLPQRERRIARHRFHLIDAGRFTAGLAVDSKGKPEHALLTYLFNAGYSEAAKWLDRAGSKIGVADTAEIAQRLAVAIGSDSARGTTAVA
jgi:NTE family protein